MRTDENFRSRVDPNHHIKYSIVEEISNFDVICDFITSDSLHLIDIGVMKRMSSRWIYGTKSYRKIFTNRNIAQFDGLLRIANQNKPSEINRPVRET